MKRKDLDLKLSQADSAGLWAFKAIAVLSSLGAVAMIAPPSWLPAPTPQNDTPPWSAAKMVPALPTKVGSLPS